MCAEQSITLTPAELGPRLLDRSPERTTAQDAASGLKRLLGRRRPALLALLEIEAAEGAVRVTAQGEHPGDALRELRELLLPPHEVENVRGEIEVDPEEFRVRVTKSEPPPDERVILRSRVRSFPYPICQWFDISTGLLTLTDKRIIYEPENLIMSDTALAGSNVHVTDLDEIQRVYRDAWWDVPCMMIETTQAVHRYGWPARRAEPELEFEVSEWIQAVRSALPEQDEREQDS